MGTERQFRSLDDVSLAEGLTRQRPAPAYVPPPLPDLPARLPNLDPNSQAGDLESAQDKLYREEIERVRRQSYREEVERNREYFSQQKEAAEAREAEIQRREQVQREEIRRRVASTDNRPPDITSRQPDPKQSYQPRPEPRPSTGSPPPTPKTSGATAQVELLDHPPPAQPRTPLSGPNPSIGATPSNLPEAASLARGATASGLGAGLGDFGFRIFNGQPIQQAVVGSIGSGAGTATGIVLGTTVAGPIGGFLGGAVGGFVGGRIADFVLGQSRPNSTAPHSRPTDPQIYQLQPPVIGFSKGNFNRNGTIIEIYSTNNRITSRREVYDYRIIFRNNVPTDAILTWWDAQNLGRRPPDFYNNPPKDPTPSASFNVDASTLKIIGPAQNLRPLTEAEVSQDEVNYPSSQPAVTSATPPADTRLPDTKNHFLNQITAPPSGSPAAGTSPQPTNYVPGGTASKSNGTARGDSPDWVSHGGPKGSPHPVNMPQPLGALLPVPMPVGTATYELEPDPQKQKLNQSYPDGKRSPEAVFAGPTEPIKLYFPSAAPVTTSVPGQPDAVKSVPSNIAMPVAGQPIQQPPPEILSKLDDFGLILVGLKQVVDGLQKPVEKIATNTTPEAIKNASNAGTCEAFSPNGCNADIRNNAASAADSSAKNSNNLERILNNTSSLADLVLLPIINSKLGPQMPGGLSSGLGRMSKFLGIDRIFNLLNFLAILHNASMLSASLKVTLLETLSSVGNATGLLQTSEGDNVDLNAVFNQGVEGLVVSLIGADAWASMKLTWRKYSAIYRAGTNVLSNVGNMFSSIGNGIEVIGERTGKIGNALRAASVVRENAYNSFSERMDVHTNKFMTFQTKVGGVTEVLEAINEIAESTIEGQEAYTEAVKATGEFKKLLNESDKNSPSVDVENKAILAEAEKIKENLVKDPTGEDEEGLLSFLTDL